MKKLEAVIITVLVCAILVMGFLLSFRIWFRLDLTKNRAYTLAPVSRNLREEIGDPVRITYYLSDRLMGIHPMPREIEDLLREYAAYSRGKIVVEVKDPAKTGLVDTVEHMGIVPQQIQSVEEDQASVSTVYSGIVIEYLDKSEIIPFVFSLDTLEYDISSRIRAMVRGLERELGVIAADSMKNWNEDYSYLSQAFEQSGFHLRMIGQGEPVPENLTLLLVLGGTEELEEWALYYIDNYIQKGGKALFAVESVQVNTQGGLEARVMTDKGLLAMLSFYGATIKPVMTLDKSALTLPLQSRGPGGMQIRLVSYPHWISVLSEFGNPNHPISARFDGADLFWANPIELNPPEGISAETLFTTTPDAWLMTKDFATNPEESFAFSREEPDTKGTQVLAAALSGTFPSWFKDAPLPLREGFPAEDLPEMPAKASPSRIVVVGDTDLATTLIQYTRSSRNLDFLLQAADWLGNDDDIINIRNRGPRAGRLDRIHDPVLRRAAMLQSQAVNVILIPLAVIVFGFFHTWRRKSRNKGREINP